MNILHIDSETSWRGGQSQIRHFINYIVDQPKSEHKCFLAAPDPSPLLEYFRYSIPCFSLHSHPARNLLKIHKLAEFCKENYIDVVDCHSSKAHDIGLLLKKFSKNLKLVVHRRVDYVPKNNFVTRYKYKHSSIDAYVAISRAIGKVLLTYGVDASKIQLAHSCYNPVRGSFEDKDKAKQSFAKELKVSGKRTWIGCFAAFTEQKDHKTLLKAIQTLKKKSSTKFQVLLAGRGHLEESLKTECELLDIHDVVTWLGFRHDITDLLQACDIFAMSSEFEGLGTVLLDAAMEKCLLVSTKTGGIPEIIIPQKTGWLSPVGDSTRFAERLADAIESIKTDPKGSIQDACFEHVQKNFSAAAMANGNIKIFDSLFS